MVSSVASTACYWQIVWNIVGGKPTELPLRQAASEADFAPEALYELQTEAELTPSDVPEADAVVAVVG